MIKLTHATLHKPIYVDPLCVTMIGYNDYTEATAVFQGGNMLYSVSVLETPEEVHTLIQEAKKENMK